MVAVELCTSSYLVLQISGVICALQGDVLVPQPLSSCSSASRYLFHDQKAVVDASNNYFFVSVYCHTAPAQHAADVLRSTRSSEYDCRRTMTAM